MKIQQLHRMYFSPTGTTKKVLEILADQIDRSGQDIDITLKQDVHYRFTAQDVLLFGIPVYSGRVPRTAVERLSHVRGENTPVILVAAYGNRDYDDALLELKKLMEMRGFVTVAAMAVSCQHSLAPSVASGRPDEKDVFRLRGFAEEIIDKMAALPDRNAIVSVKVKGNTPFREYQSVPVKPVTSSACVRCGLCAANCPAGAIPVENPAETDKGQCISCMRCVSLCPEQARKVPAVMQFGIKWKLSGKCKERKEAELFL